MAVKLDPPRSTIRCKDPSSAPLWAIATKHYITMKSYAHRVPATYIWARRKEGEIYMCSYRCARRPVYWNDQADMLDRLSSISAWPVRSRERCSNSFRSSGRAASSEGLYRVGGHQNSLPRVVGVIYRCWRRYRGEKQQRGSYRSPDHQKPWGRLALSWAT